MWLIEKIILLSARHCSAWIVVLLFLTLNCSNRSANPDDGGPSDNGPVGVLLSGADSDSALSGTSNHGPFVVPESEWDGDFVTTRLEAVINPSATVGGVNTALNAVGAKISCMQTDMMFTELVVPAQASVTQAEVICSTLVASGAFLWAYPCFDPTASNDGAVVPGFPANIRITPLEEAKFPAAWNVRELVARRNSPVTIMVADDFGRLVAHTEIPAQTFVPGSATADTMLDSSGNVAGNHGFAVAGAIGARYDDIGSTGAFADTANILRLPCYAMPAFGSWTAVMIDLASRLPFSGRFILNTSWGYGGNFTRFSKLQRIEHAFYWRALVARRQNDFLHTQSSGNDGLFSPTQTNADYNSPFTLSARFDNPFQMLQGTTVTPADTAALTTLYAQAIVNGGIYATKLHNVITVGSSDWSGNLSSFSNGPADVRMIGENVTLPCLTGDGVCAPGTDVAWQGSHEGTSFSSPQVAALAGWLWALSPSLAVDETIATIMNCYNSKWVDAYKAVLSLDHSISGADVRLTLFDVADGNGNVGSNNKFDEKDLLMIHDSILYYEASRGAISPPWTRDHSRFDLNGDGFTGDTMLTPSTAPFDLDINTPSVLSMVSPPECADTSFDESKLTDRDILYYYAYSDLYIGADSIRDSLIPCGAQVIARGSEYNSSASAYSIQVVSWKRDDVDTSKWIPNQIDTTDTQERVVEESEGSDPVSVNNSASVQCGSFTFKASARVEVTYFVATGNIVTGISAAVQCEETDQTPADSNCLVGWASADAGADPAFQVKGGTIGFSISARTTGGSTGRAKVGFNGPSGVILDLHTGESGSATGELPPGTYGFYVDASGNCSASATITFSPL